MTSPWGSQSYIKLSPAGRDERRREDPRPASSTLCCPLQVLLQPGLHPLQLPLQPVSHPLQLCPPQKCRQPPDVFRRGRVDQPLRDAFTDTPDGRSRAVLSFCSSLTHVVQQQPQAAARDVLVQEEGRQNVPQVVSSICGREQSLVLTTIDQYPFKAISINLVWVSVNGYQSVLINID